jgi:hypothetical protein
MAKYFIKAPDGTAYTNLEDDSGKALSVATNKFTGTPYRRKMFKGAGKVWDDMKAKGFTIEKRFVTSNDRGHALA